MNRIKTRILVLAMFSFILGGITGYAAPKIEDFNKIAKMNARELMVKTKEVMEAKYLRRTGNNISFLSSFSSMRR